LIVKAQRDYSPKYLQLMAVQQGLEMMNVVTPQRMEELKSILQGYQR